MATASRASSFSFPVLPPGSPQGTAALASDPQHLVVSLPEAGPLLSL